MPEDHPTQEQGLSLRECVTGVFLAIIAAFALVLAVLIASDAYVKANADPTLNSGHIESVRVSYDRIRVVEVPKTVYIDRPVYIDRTVYVPQPVVVPPQSTVYVPEHPVYVPPPEPGKGAGFVARDGHVLQWNEQLKLADLQVGMPVCRLNRKFGALNDDSGTVRSLPYTSRAGEWKFDIQTAGGRFDSVYATDGGLAPYTSGTYNDVNITVYGTCNSVMWPVMK